MKEVDKASVHKLEPSRQSDYLGFSSDARVVLAQHVTRIQSGLTSKIHGISIAYPFKPPSNIFDPTSDRHSASMSDQIQDLLDIPRDFFKDGTQFMNKCTKRMDFDWEQTPQGRMLIF